MTRNWLVGVFCLVLLGAGLVAVLRAMDPAASAQQDTTPEELVEMADGAAAYAREEGGCPGSATDLVAFGYADGALDLWGHSYRIICAAGKLTVRSDGPDGQPGSPDDLSLDRPLDR